MKMPRARPPLNTFGVAFGLTGLAGAWTEATEVLASPQFIGEALWCIALLVWLTIAVFYFGRLHSWKELLGDLKHPVLGPFAALIPIPPMLLGAHLVRISPAVGVTLVCLCVVVSAVFGAWFTSQLLTVTRGFGPVHSGYFLPTVAAALLSAQSLAVIGQPKLAVGTLGIGILFWLLIGGAVIARVIAGPESLAALMPTLGIFSAPPAVAGNAWWIISAGHGGTISQLLAGAMAAVIAPHLFLVGRYAKLPFTLGFWALTFTAAASATFTIRLLSAERAPWAVVVAWIVLAAATSFICAIGVRSLALLTPRRKAPS